MMWCFLASYLSWLTPMTMVMSSFLAGAEMMTFLAPALMWAEASSVSVKKPVDSMTMSTPRAAQSIRAGSRSDSTAIGVSPASSLPSP